MIGKGVFFKYVVREKILIISGKMVFFKVGPKRKNIYLLKEGPQIIFFFKKLALIKKVPREKNMYDLLKNMVALKNMSTEK